jgi:hypothetical protein
MLTLAALILIAAPALADMETDLGLAIDVTGDAFPANSYAKNIMITTATPFDLIAVMPAGDSSVLLSDPYLSNFSRTGWMLLTVPEPDEMLAAAQGSTPTQSLRLNIELLPDGEPSTAPHAGDAFLVAVWAAPMDPVGEWEYQYDCRRIGFSVVNGWTVENLGTPGEWNISRAEITHVPAPAAIGLGVLGLGLVGWYMRRYA